VLGPHAGYLLMRLLSIDPKSIFNVLL